MLTDSKVRGRRSREAPQVEEKEADSYCLSQVSASSCRQKQDPGVVDLGLLWHKERHHIMSGRKGESGAVAECYGWAKCGSW